MITELLVTMETKILHYSARSGDNYRRFTRGSNFTSTQENVLYLTDEYKFVLQI